LRYCSRERRRYCSPPVLGYKFSKWDNDDKKIAQAFQMLGLFIWYLGIWLGNQNDRTNNASNLEPSRARVRRAWRRINKAMTSGAARAAALAAVKRVAGCALAAREQSAALAEPR
jgi:hypothetical protein